MIRPVESAHGDDREYARELEEHRPYLLRVARLQLRDSHVAEDAVQETMLAALKYRESFAGQSSFRTWLISILKRKIIDIFRKQSREPKPGAVDETFSIGEGEPDELFADDGHWREPPAAWSNPEKAFEAKDFWRIFEMCNQAMPAAIARVFMMREVLELSTEDICKELGITATNCHVMLYRARVRLQRCLNEKWFERR